MFKQRLTAAGVPLKHVEVHNVVATQSTALLDPKANTTCMSCYGAEDRAGACCNTCDEVSRSSVVLRRRRRQC